jgi:hypothetical protein
MIFPFNLSLFPSYQGSQKKYEDRRHEVFLFGIRFFILDTSRFEGRSPGQLRFVQEV